MISHDESDLAGLSDQVGTLTPSTPEDLAAARTYTTRHAHNATDLGVLLGALGMDPA